MSVEAIIGEIEAKISSLSGLPPDLSEQYDKLRDEFANAPIWRGKTAVAKTASKPKKSAAKK